MLKRSQHVIAEFHSIPASDVPGDTAHMGKLLCGESQLSSRRPQPRLVLSRASLQRRNFPELLPGLSRI
jgi:hypothetical protein